MRGKREGGGKEARVSKTLAVSVSIATSFLALSLMGPGLERGVGPPLPRKPGMDGRCYFAGLKLGAEGTQGHVPGARGEPRPQDGSLAVGPSLPPVLGHHDLRGRQLAPEMSGLESKPRPPIQYCSDFTRVQVQEKADSPIQLDWGFFLRQVEHLRI